MKNIRNICPFMCFLFFYVFVSKKCLSLQVFIDFWRDKPLSLQVFFNFFKIHKLINPSSKDFL